MLNNHFTKNEIIKMIGIVVILILFGRQQHKRYLFALYTAQSQHKMMQEACNHYGWESCECKKQKIFFNEDVKAKEKAQWWKIRKTDKTPI
jgi:hypothetical protein